MRLKARRRKKATRSSKPKLGTHPKGELPDRIVGLGRDASQEVEDVRRRRDATRRQPTACRAHRAHGRPSSHPHISLLSVCRYRCRGAWHYLIGHHETRRGSSRTITTANTGMSADRCLLSRAWIATDACSMPAPSARFCFPPFGSRTSWCPKPRLSSSSGSARFSPPAGLN